MEHAVALTPEDEKLDSALRRLSAAIDEVWEIVRQRRAADASAYRIATLSSSLADPRSFEIEVVLSHGVATLDSDADRSAFVQVVRACLEKQLIAREAAERLERLVFKPRE